MSLFGFSTESGESWINFKPKSFRQRFPRLYKRIQEERKQSLFPKESNKTEASGDVAEFNNTTEPRTEN